MSLTKCPDCQRLRFHSDQTCTGCAREFRPGELSAQAAAENRGFMRRAHTVFLVTFAVLLLTLLLTAPPIT